MLQENRLTQARIDEALGADLLGRVVFYGQSDITALLEVGGWMDGWVGGWGAGAAAWRRWGWVGGWAGGRARRSSLDMLEVGGWASPTSPR